MLLGLGLFLAATLAACGGGGTGGSSSGGGSGGQAVVTTRSATVGGKSETILTNDSGMTLYYFDPDTATSVACSGSCAQTWPPLLASGGSPTSMTSLSGTLATMSDSNGAQVTYNGHPLYTYSGDHAAGDTHGDGVLGKWHAATPNVATLGGGTSTGGNNPGY